MIEDEIFIPIIDMESFDEGTSTVPILAPTENVTTEILHKLDNGFTMMVILLAMVIGVLCALILKFR